MTVCHLLGKLCWGLAQQLPHTPYCGVIYSDWIPELGWCSTWYFKISEGNSNIQYVTLPKVLPLLLPYLSIWYTTVWRGSTWVAWKSNSKQCWVEKHHSRQQCCRCFRETKTFCNCFLPNRVYWWALAKIQEKNPKVKMHLKEKQMLLKLHANCLYW